MVFFKNILELFFDWKKLPLQHDEKHVVFSTGTIHCTIFRVLFIVILLYIFYIGFIIQGFSLYKTEAISQPGRKTRSILAK